MAIKVYSRKEKAEKAGRKGQNILLLDEHNPYHALVANKLLTNMSCRAISCAEAAISEWYDANADRFGHIPAATLARTEGTRTTPFLEPSPGKAAQRCS